MYFLKELQILLSDFKVQSLGLNAKNTILFVDIDDTLFNTGAKVIVEDKESKEEIRQLSSSEFNDYNLNSGEQYNFKQFTDSKIFKTTSNVIRSTAQKLHIFQQTFDKKDEGYKNNKIIFVTARSDMDNKHTFLDAFSRQGIRVSDKKHVYIRRIGSESHDGESIHAAKARIMKEYLNRFDYDRAIFFDDSIANLKAFAALSPSYSNTDFISICVSSGKLYQMTNKRKQKRSMT